MYRFILSQLRAYKTKRQLIVIESDDWGSERIPNSEVRQSLISSGVDMLSNPHSKYDTLERLEDLEVLESLLQDLYDNYQKKVKITANFITSNPDFQKIKDTDFANYYYEPFTRTYLNRDGHDMVINKIHDLSRNSFLKPQFHGREHINVSFWLQELRRRNRDYLSAFELNCYAIDASSSRNSKNLLAALDFENNEQLEFVQNSISEGHLIFKNTFGFPSETFIAPRYVWSEDLNSVFISEGLKGIQSSLCQQVTSSSDCKKYFHFTGEKNKDFDLKYSVRNVFFEPAYSDLDWVNSALQKVEWAFRFKTPAIISMHRINFVGGLDKTQRDHNLIKFKVFLEEVIRRYPNVEFLSSDELLKLM